MSKINNKNFLNLFQNYQRIVACNNNNNKNNKAEEKNLLNQRNNLLDIDKLFDLNNDNKFDENDVDLFFKGDINGDGQTSEEERNFVNANKDAFTESLKQKGVNIFVDNNTGNVKYTSRDGLNESVYDSNGDKTKTRRYTGGTIQYVKKYSNVDNLQYSATRSGDTIVFQKGNESKTVKLSGGTAVIHDDGSVTITSKDKKSISVYSEEGTKKYNITYNGKNPIKNISGNTITFNSGKTVSFNDGANIIVNDGVNITDGNTSSRYYSGGTLQYSITDNNGSAYPKRDGNKVRFSSNSDAAVALAAGETAVINSDGTVTVNSKDGRTVSIYSSNGSLSEKTVTGKTLNASGCDVNTITKYDADGNITSNVLRIYQRTYKGEYIINSIPADMDTSKITKVSSNSDGSFSVTAGGTVYTFKRIPEKNRAYHAEYNNATGISSSSQNGCRVNVIKEYDENGNITSNHTKISIPNGPAVTLETGENYSVNADGSVTVTSANGSKKIITKDKIEFYVDNKLKKSMDVGSGVGIDINATGEVFITSADGKTVNKYYKGGTLQYTDTYNANKDGNWTECIRTFVDSKGNTTKTELTTKTVNNDNTYSLAVNQYDANNKLTYAGTTIYYNSGLLEGKKKSMFYYEPNESERIHVRNWEYDNLTGRETSEIRKSYSKPNMTQNNLTAYLNNLSNGSAVINEKTLVESKKYEFLSGNEEEGRGTVTHRILRNGTWVTETANFVIDKDENGLKYRHYVWNTGKVEHWYYDENGKNVRQDFIEPNNTGVICLRIFTLNASGKFVPSSEEPFTGEYNGNFYVNGKLI